MVMELCRICKRSVKRGLTDVYVQVHVYVNGELCARVQQRGFARSAPEPWIVHVNVNVNVNVNVR